MLRKIIHLLREMTPVVLMIGLIPFIDNDYLLTVLYCVIIIAGLLVKKEKGDSLIMLVGFFTMLVSETFFISTGVETFGRHTLFNIMPLWLPFLWAYAFVVIRRSLRILEL